MDETRKRAAPVRSDNNHRARGGALRSLALVTLLLFAAMPEGVRYPQRAGGGAPSCLRGPWRLTLSARTDECAT